MNMKSLVTSRKSNNEDINEILPSNQGFKISHPSTVHFFSIQQKHHIRTIAGKRYKITKSVENFAYSN